jgi:hypothetical protein
MTVAFNLSQLANYVNSSGKLDAANGLVNATPVPNGGTGAATATAYAVQCGGTTSTGAHQSIASVGTTGQVLTSNGASTLPTFETPVATGFINMTVFTASGTWTVPSGITRVKVTVVGGGGNALGSDEVNYGGGGGGGTAIKNISSGLGSTVSVTIGAAGGTSSFGAFCSASGGAASTTVVGGLGGIGSSGDLNVRGTSGSYGAGAGGSSFLGGGGNFNDVGGQYGGGAGGGANPTKAGASGVVVIEY